VNASSDASVPPATRPTGCDALAGFVARTEELGSVLKIDNYKVTTPTGARLDIQSSDAASSWGLKAHLLIADEFCQSATTPGPRRLWQASGRWRWRGVENRARANPTAGLPPAGLRWRRGPRAASRIAAPVDDQRPGAATPPAERREGSVVFRAPEHQR
jgi:hypothetical protein